MNTTGKYKDTTKTGNARLARDEHGSGTWRGWKISQSPRSKGYVATHREQQVERQFPDLAAVKRVLPRIDEAVVAGEVPEGFSRTSARERREYLEGPMKHRRDKINQEVRRYMEHIVDQYREQHQKLIEAVTRNPNHATEWEAGPTIKLQRMAAMASLLLKASDRDLPLAVQRGRDGLLSQMLLGSSTSGSTCAFTRAAEAANLDAVRKFFEQYEQYLMRYQMDNVPTTDEESR